MQTFKDSEGRSWNLAVNVAAIKRVRDLVKVNLYAVGDPGSTVLADLSGDPVLLVDVLYCLCKPQADAQNVTDAQFGEAMGGNAVDDATQALLEEVSDFFPKARRAVMRKILTTARALEEKAATAVVAKLDADLASGKLEKDIGLTPPDSKDSAGSSPGSSASTPAPSR